MLTAWPACGHPAENPIEIREGEMEVSHYCSSCFTEEEVRRAIEENRAPQKKFARRELQ